MLSRLDPELRRALLEEARDRLRSLRGEGRTEALVAVHSLSASAASAGVSDLLALLTSLERELTTGASGAIDRCLAAVVAALERSREGEDETAELLECFGREASEHLATMEQLLDVLAEDPENGDAADGLYRALHTFKGAAAMVGLTDGSSAAHMLEEMLEQVREGHRALDRPLLSLLGAGANLLRVIVEEPDRAEDHGRALAALAGAHGTLAQGRAADLALAEGKRRPERRREAPHLLRVPLEETAKLLALSRQARMLATSMTPEVSALRGIAADLLSMRDRQGLGASGSPGVGVDRGARPFSDIASAVLAIERGATAVEGHVTHLHRVATALERAVDGFRVTPASWLFDRLVAVAEEAAQRTERSVAITAVGEDVQVDRAVAAQLLDPLVHLVRNAVVHGCEPRAQRVAMGKEPSGRLRLEAFGSADGVRYAVADDGPGVDLASIRRRVARTGLRPAEEVEVATDDQVLDWIFLPGVSSRERADELSGRGVGLDAVRAAVSGLGGTVAVSTRLGAGTRFEISVPNRVGSLHVVVVGHAGHRFAIPSGAVRRIVQLPEEGAAGSRVLLEEGDLPILRLGSLLGLKRRPSAHPTALLVATGEGLTALEVEQVLGVCEVSVHTLTGLLAELGPYTGAAVDREWGLVLVVDLRRIWAPREEPILSFEGPRILVVDDSQTVRALSASALEAAGYDVDLAADGLEALQLLHKERYDLLLTDVEMPRLDGLGLLERLRAEPRLSRLPVVILTSRPGDVARGRASELGVRALLQKPVTATRLVREVTAALERG